MKAKPKISQFDVEWGDYSLIPKSKRLYGGSNELPIEGEIRPMLASSKFSAGEKHWVGYQPGRSSRNKSFEDDPYEIEESGVVQVEIIKNLITLDRGNGNSVCPISHWYSIKVLNFILFQDFPEQWVSENQMCFEYFQTNQLDFYYNVFDLDNYLILHADSQGHAGFKILFLKRGDSLIQVYNEEYFGDNEYFNVCNYLVSDEIKKEIKSSLNSLTSEAYKWGRHFVGRHTFQFN